MVVTMGNLRATREVATEARIKEYKEGSLAEDVGFEGRALTSLTSPVRFRR